MPVSFKQRMDGTYEPDQSRLVLHCGEKVVGTCNFNVASYIDKAPVIEKAVVYAEGGQPPAEGPGLVGDATNFPGAYIEFRMTVSAPDSKQSIDPAYASGGPR